MWRASSPSSGCAIACRPWSPPTNRGWSAPDGLSRQHLAQRQRHPLHVTLPELREERQGQRAGGHVLTDRELALAVAEALPVEAHQVDRRQVGLRIDPPLA